MFTVAGERIGVVGATTPYLARITGVGGITVHPSDGSDVDALAAIIQQVVDQLVDQGIDKIILLAHMQKLTVEKALASRLGGVDIIIAGGSNSLLADETDRLRTGDEAAGAYPLRFDSPVGEPVLVVNTDGDYRYLGRLVVDFDGRGVVLPGSVDPLVSGAYATDGEGGQTFSGPAHTGGEADRRLAAASAEEPRRQRRGAGRAAISPVLAATCGRRRPTWEI